MSQDQYFNKAKDTAKRNGDVMDFLDNYPPRNNTLSASRLSKKLAKIFNCAAEVDGINLYLVLRFGLKK